LLDFAMTHLLDGFQQNLFWRDASSYSTFWVSG
jgi:hypothetical protein